MAIRIGKAEWPNIRTFLAELIGAAIIFAIPIGAIWGYYIVTGQPLDFGG